MSTIWPHEKIRELIALAEASGEASAILETNEDARLFRFAIYTFRRDNKLGRNLTVMVDDTKVLLYKKPPKPKVIIENIEDNSCQ